MLTMREVLELPEVRRGLPEVLAGEERLDAPVRWVHVSELPDIAPLLRGGELILTTGIALPESDAELRRYVDELVAARAAGLVVELGRRFRSLPRAVVRRAAEHGLPLVALRQEVRFVRITEAVHSVVVDAQVSLLQSSEEVNRRFTELALEGAGAERILAALAELSGRAVVLENLAHQVIGYVAGPVPVGELLGRWEERSRFVHLEGRSAVVAMPDRWLVTSVGARGSRWGRLFLRLEGEPTHLDGVVLERGATALAMSRLMERERATLERMTHRALIDDVRSGAAADDDETALRAAALGVPLTGRRLVGAVARITTSPGQLSGARLRDAAETVAAVARELGVPALVGAGGSDEIVMVLSLPADRRSTRERLDRVMRRVRDRLATALPGARTWLAVGSVVDEISMLRSSLGEAEQVAQAAPGLAVDKPYHELADVRLRGLLFLLREDPRLQTFVEQQLGPLLRHDAAHGTDLLGTLAAYLASGGSKSAAALELGLSRPALYQRLSRLERIVGASLDDAEARLSLHVALTALQVLRAEGAPAAG